MLRWRDWLAICCRPSVPMSCADPRPAGTDRPLEPEKAVAALPKLLADPQDRARMMSLLDAVVADQRVWKVEPTAEQKLALQRIEAVLGHAVPLPVAAKSLARKAPAAKKPATRKPVLRAAAKKS